MGKYKRSFHGLRKTYCLQVNLQVAPPLVADLLNGVKLGLEGEHQYLNAGLAVALCSTWLQRTGHLEATYLEQTVSSMHERSLVFIS